MVSSTAAKRDETETALECSNTKTIINILGTKWTLEIVRQEDDKYLKTADGYADKTLRKIVVCGFPPDDSELGDWEPYVKKCIRHEIIHAYLFESGLHENFQHPEAGHDETYVDWVSVQFPKLMKTFQEVGAL